VTLETPLTTALRLNHIPIVQAVLDAKADVNHPLWDPPINRALRVRFERLTELLIQHGAHVNCYHQQPLAELPSTNEEDNKNRTLVDHADPLNQISTPSLASLDSSSSTTTNIAEGKKAEVGFVLRNGVADQSIISVDDNSRIYVRMSPGVEHENDADNPRPNHLLQAINVRWNGTPTNDIIDHRRRLTGHESMITRVSPLSEWLCSSNRSSTVLEKLIAAGADVWAPIYRVGYHSAFDGTNLLTAIYSKAFQGSGSDARKNASVSIVYMCSLVLLSHSFNRSFVWFLSFSLLYRSIEQYVMH
jgi:hypothetical protein